jgi:hypothetical protein
MGGQKQLTQLYFSLLPAQSKNVFITAHVSGGFRKEPVAANYVARYIIAEKEKYCEARVSLYFNCGQDAAAKCSITKRKRHLE